MEQKSLGRGFLILSIAGIATKLLSAIYVPLLRAIIGQTGYGVYTAGYDIFVFLIAVTSLGAQPAVTKVVTELRAVGNTKDALRAMKIARKYLAIVSIIIAIIFALISFPLAKLTNREQSALTFLFLSPAIIFAAILAAYRGYMQGVEEMQSLGISQVIEQFINVLLSLVFGFVLISFTRSTAWGSAGGTIGTSLGAIIAIIYIIYIYKKNNYEDLAIKEDNSRKRISDKRILRKLLIYTVPITLVAGLQNFAGVIDTVTLGKGLTAGGFSNTDIDNMSALLSYYKTLVYVPLSIVTAFGTSIFQSVIQAFIRKERKVLKKQVSYAFRITYLIVIPATFGLSILSKEVYLFLFNTDKGYNLLTYGSALLIFMSITTIQNVILQGINKLYLIIVSATSGIVVKILINILLVRIPDVNIMGAMIGTFVSFIIPSIINHRQLKRFLKVRIPIIGLAIIPTICSIFMSIAIVFAKNPLSQLVLSLGNNRIAVAIETLILIIIGAIVYLYSMVYLGGIGKQDVALFPARLVRVLPRGIRKKLT